MNILALILCRDAVGANPCEEFHALKEDELAMRLEVWNLVCARQLVQSAARNSGIERCLFKCEYILAVAKDVLKVIDTLLQQSHLLDQGLCLFDIADRVHNIKGVVPLVRWLLSLAFCLTDARMLCVILPTHRYTSLLWHVGLDLMPLDIAGCGVCLCMVVHETTDVREGIDILATELAVAKQSMLVP